MGALDLATELVETPFESTRTEAAAMLRKQAEAIQQLREALKGAHWRLKEYDYQAMERTIARCEAALAATEEYK